MQVLANATLVIVLQYISASITMLYILNLQGLCLLYFNKAGKKSLKNSLYMPGIIRSNLIIATANTY